MTYEHTVDFTGVKTYWDFHERLKTALDFPDYYGKNLSALWDCLTDFCDPTFVTLIELNTLPKEMSEVIKLTVETFEDAEKEMDYFHFTIAEAAPEQ